MKNTKAFFIYFFYILIYIFFYIFFYALTLLTCQ